MNRRHEIQLPDLDLGEEPIRLSLWLVEPGAEVTAGDRVVEILAGPATVDLAAPASGVLTEILVAEDQVVVSGQTLGVILEPDEAARVESAP